MTKMLTALTLLIASSVSFASRIESDKVACNYVMEFGRFKIKRIDENTISAKIFSLNYENKQISLDYDLKELNYVEAESGYMTPDGNIRISVFRSKAGNYIGGSLTVRNREFYSDSYECNRL